MTLLELAGPLFISLIALMPAHVWQIGPVVVAILGYLSILGYFILYYYCCITARPEVRWYDHMRGIIGTIFLSLVYTMILLSTMQSDVKHGLYMLAAACIWQVMSGVTQSWLLISISGKDFQIRE